MSIQLPNATPHNLSNILRQTQRVVDRGVDVARGDGVADAVERVAPGGIADDGLRTVGDEGGVIDLAAIARSRLQPEVELVERQGAVLDDDLVDFPQMARLVVGIDQRRRQTVTGARDAFES